MSWGDGSANLSANALPEMVLRMSLTVELRDAGRNESQADIRLLIPRIYSVNPDASCQGRRLKPLGRWSTPGVTYRDLARIMHGGLAGVV